jgi:beta-N-acetylhexosaminidase
MKALDGSIPELAAAAIAAGCDLVLNCWGKMDDMVGIARQTGTISAASRARLDGAMARIAASPEPRGYDELVERRDALLALV